MEGSWPQRKLIFMKKLLIFLLFPFAAFAQPASSGYLLTNSNGSVSIGTQVNTAPLTIANFTTSFVAPQVGTTLHIVSDASTNNRISSDTYNNSSFTGSIFQGKRARGSAASPTPPLADDILVAIGGDGYGVDSFTNSSVGSMNIRSETTFTNISKPTYISFTTTPTASITQAERMRIASTGALRLNAYGTGAIIGTATYAAQFDASGNLIEGALGGGGVTQGALDDTAADIRAAIPVVTGTNTGDNAANTTYANDYRAANFIAGTNYLAPNGSGAALTSIPITAITGYTGYTLSVQALTSSPADGATIYFGQLPKAPVSAAATSKIYIRKAGTIKAANIYCYSGTAGTAEAWPINIRLNNTTDTQIASVAAATNERVFSNTGLSISVSVGDYIEIKSVNPTWATNPLTTIFGGYIYIE